MYKYTIYIALLDVMPTDMAHVMFTTFVGKVMQAANGFDIIQMSNNYIQIVLMELCALCGA